MAWMAWTTPSALFFSGIALILITMTILEIRTPCIERKGVSANNNDARRSLVYWFIELSLYPLRVCRID
ncbi:DUF2160 family membrane protein [Vibrio sinaloensis]|nr:DUF2160 family membrane protein [Vibrio sinaloensis]